MKLVINTLSSTSSGKNYNSYLVKLPNYFDVSTVEEVVDKAKHKLPADEVVTEYMMYGDWVLTVEERNQIDYFGKVTHSPTVLNLDNE